MSDYRITTTQNTSPVDLEPEPIKPRSTTQKLARFLIAGIFLVGMVYLYGGLHQYVRFHQTPTNTATGTYASVIDADTTAVPVTVFVLTRDAASGSQLQQGRRIAQQASQILLQAAVELNPISVRPILVQDQDFSGAELVSDPSALKRILPELSSDQLHIVIVDTLGGINGIAFSGRQAVAVAEYTTSFDFRVLAHEMGHAFGLSHVDDRSNLMYSGSSGTTLTKKQAQHINQSAEAFIGDNS